MESRSKNCHLRVWSKAMKKNGRGQAGNWEQAQKKQQHGLQKGGIVARGVINITERCKKFQQG